MLKRTISYYSWRHLTKHQLHIYIKRHKDCGNRNDLFFCVAKQRSPQSPLRSPATSSDVLLGDQAGALDSTLLAQATRTQTGSYPAILPRKLSRQSCTLRDPEDASSRKTGLCVYKCSDSKYQLYYLKSWLHERTCPHGFCDIKHKNYDHRHNYNQCHKHRNS